MYGYDIIFGDSYYVHLETSNKSFLNIHYFFKSIGIQNNSFMLKLYDTDLIGVDPYDPTLSPVMKSKVLAEIIKNYWYFIREVVRIPVQGSGGAGVHFELHVGNCLMSTLFLLDFSQYVEFPRQFYKTWTSLTWYLWLYNFASTNSETALFHKDHANAKENLSKLKSIRDALPSYLQMSTTVGADGKKLKVPNTIQTIQNPFNNNKIVTFASARSKEAADKMGRGATIPNLYFDEQAFQPYNEYVYQAAMPAYSRAAKNAKANGVHYSILITTTPGDLATEEGQFSYSIRNNATKWCYQYYDMTRAQLEALRDANTNSQFFLNTYTYQQLGGGPDYFKAMVVQSQRNYAAIRREVLLEWATLANNCPFSQEDLDKIKDFCREPIRTIFFGKYNQYQMLIFEEIDLRYPPIIGVDVSGALYNDSSAITVIDSKTTRVIAILNCNYIPSDDLADVVYTLVTRYMPNSIVNIERNGDITLFFFTFRYILLICLISIVKIINATAVRVIYQYQQG